MIHTRNFQNQPVAPSCLQQSSMRISAPENSWCSLRKILLKQVCNLIPAIPFTYQDDQLNVQGEARDRPWLPRQIIERTPLSNSTAFPVLSLSKYGAHQNTHQFDLTSTTKPIHPPVQHKYVRTDGPGLYVRKQQYSRSSTQLNGYL